MENADLFGKLNDIGLVLQQQSSERLDVFSIGNSGSDGVKVVTIAEVEAFLAGAKTCLGC